MCWDILNLSLLLWKHLGSIPVQSSPDQGCKNWYHPYVGGQDGDDLARDVEQTHDLITVR